MNMNNLSVFFFSKPWYRRHSLEKIISKYFMRFSKELSKGTFLEIGCASGIGAFLIKNYFSPSKIISIDLDKRMVDIARKNIQDPSIFFEVGNASKLRFGDNHFDAVFDFIVIHHIPNWKDCLEELYRVLKPQGKLFVYDVSIESFNTLFGRIMKITSRHPYRYMYKKSDFIECLEKTGFKIIKKEDIRDIKKHFMVVAEKT